jgi:hypothetical protein
LTTNAYAAKRSIFDRLATLTGPGQRLDGIEVAYKYPGKYVTTRCIYGGGVTFVHADAAVDGREVLTLETANIILCIRIVERDLGDDDVRTADAEAERIGDILGEILTAEPGIAGGSSTTTFAGGTGDHQITDDEVITVLAYQLTVSSYL